MIKVFYRKNDGLTMPDGKIEEFVKNLVESYLSTSNSKKDDVTVVVGSSMIITHFQIAIFEKKISNKEIVFIAEDGTELNPNVDGRINFYPKDFCDFIENSLLRLL